jgi:hypothetical protein
MRWAISSVASTECRFFQKSGNKPQMMYAPKAVITPSVGEVFELCVTVSYMALECQYGQSNDLMR